MHTTFPPCAPFADDGEPVEIVAPLAASPLLLVCDHASHRVPARLAALGLPEAERLRHIGWDIGAGETCRQLSALLGATAVLGGVSRLVIDCNRRPGHPTSICPISDGTVVPGNAGLSEADALERVHHYFAPFHHAVSAQAARLEQHGRVATIIAIHSFTPVMGGFRRPWHVGVLWSHDPRLAVPLIDSLRRRDGLCVGDNEPYSGRGELGYTIETHGDAHGRPHVSLEIRQDEIGHPAGCRRWAELLAELLRPLLADPIMAERRRYTSPGKMSADIT